MLMKIRTAKLIGVFVLLVTCVRSQTIPNAGFENWTQDIWSNMNPDGWEHSNEDFQGAKIVMDFGVQGNWSLHAINFWWIGARGWAKCRFPSAIHPAALAAYVKTDFDSIDTVNITVYVFMNGAIVDSGLWIGTTASPLPGWTFISIPITQLSASADSVEIQLNGGLLPGTSLHVDALAFTATGINESRPDALISVFPNPVENEMQVLSHIHDVHELDLYDATGRILAHVHLEYGTNKIDLSGFAKGSYFYQLMHKGVVVSCDKIIKL